MRNPCDETVFCLDSINVGILVVIMYYSFVVSFN